MKSKIICLMFVFLVIFGIWPLSDETMKASAEEQKVTYKYNSSTKTLTFSGRGLLGDDSKLREKYQEKAEHIVIEDGITGIDGTFFCWKKIKSIDLPDEMTYLGQQSFALCTSLTEIELPDGVSFWGYDLFQECTSLKSVHFGSGTDSASVYGMGNMFRGCKSLTTITTESDSDYRVVDGVLFIDNNLVCYPPKLKGEHYDIPKGTVGILEEAFTLCNNLKTVSIPDSIATLGFCFYNCKNLTSLTIPASVEAFTNGRVYDTCKNLQQITNNSAAELELPRGIFWKSRKTGLFTETISSDIVDRVELKMPKYEGETFKADGITYKVVEMWNVDDFSANVLNKKMPLGSVKVVKFDSKYKVSSKVLYGQWCYEVISPANYPVKNIKNKILKNVSLNLSEKDYDSIVARWSKLSVMGPTVSYKVEYKKQGGKWKTYQKSESGTSCTIKNLSDGAKCFVRITPHITVNGNTYYGKAKTVSVYTLKKVDRPKAFKDGYGMVKISWKNIEGESGYQISKSAKKTGTKIIATYKTTKGTYKTVTTTEGKKFYYKVRAYKSVNGKKVYGPWSTAVYR